MSLVLVLSPDLLWPSLDSLVAGLLIGPALPIERRGRFALWMGGCDGLASVIGRLLPPYHAFTLPDWLGYLLAVSLACAGLLGFGRALIAIPVLLSFDNLLQPEGPVAAGTGSALSAGLGWVGLSIAAALCGRRLLRV